jgi:EAL domain-containing protein (putative c-di-GMP-specific phosphodiesterase class I)
LNIKVKEDLRLENELRDAIFNNKLTLFFQPIVSFADKRFVGVETLVRWQHPEFGLLLPDKFIGLAEKANLIYPLGDWVLTEALRTFNKWQEQHLDLDFITVNFSTMQFKSQIFNENVEKALTESKVSSNKLVIEITESVLMDSQNLAIEKLNQLKKRGIEIAIDDFGTGYSSLSYLRKMPIHYLKIDKEFVSSLPDNEESKAIVNSIIALSRSLGMLTIAEGIETPEQFAYLKMQGCNLAQGFLMSRPLPPEKIVDLFVEIYNLSKQDKNYSIWKF